MTEISNPLSKIDWRVAVAVLIATTAALPVDTSVAVGVAAGGAWNLVSLWCLGRLLGAWMGPAASTKRVVGWLLVKFFLLYLAAYMLIFRTAVSLVGFSIGFTVVLIATLVLLVVRSRTPVVPIASKR